MIATRQLGRLAFSLEGEGKLFSNIAEELSRCPSSSAPADIRFRIVESLPVKPFRRSGGILVTDDGLRVETDFGCTYELRHIGDTIEIDLEPTLPHGMSLRRRVPKWLHWNYLHPVERLAKNIMYDVFDWSTQLMQLRKGQTYIHASSMVRGDRAIAVLGWGGVGKTTSLLKLCLEEGWHYLSDDLGLIDDLGTLYRTPKHLQVYGYNLVGQPGIRRRLMSGRSAMDRLSWQAYRRTFGPKMVRRRIRAEDFFGQTGVAQSARLTDIVFLERSSDPELVVSSMGTAELARRMAAVVMTEIDPYAHLYRQAVAAGTDMLVSPDQLQEETQQVLEKAFAGMEPVFVKVGAKPEPDKLAELLCDLTA